MMATAVKEKRLTRLERWTAQEKAMWVKAYHEAPDEATFIPDVVALVHFCSTSWLQQMRCNKTDAIPFQKVSKKTVLYRKGDVEKFFSAVPALSTSIKTQAASTGR